MNQAVSICGDLSAPGKLVITCEHASSRVPPPLCPTIEDREWLATHYGFDIGAAEVVRELARRTNSLGILAQFSRLVCDANRHASHPEWICLEIEGYAPSFNRHLDSSERIRRRRTYYDPYHEAVDRLLALHDPDDVLLVAVHSFTPRLGQEVREMEIGVLFDQHESLARDLARLIGEQTGYHTALNQPYSGFDGMIYSVCRHGQELGVPYLEVEVRQDLVDTVTGARVVAGQLAGALRDLAAPARGSPPCCPA